MSLVNIPDILFFAVFNTEEKYVCPNCNRRFKVATSVRRHVKYFCGRKPPPITGYVKHNDDDYECITCHKRYKLFGTLKRHIIHECGKPKKIECPLPGCEYRAKMRDRMINHCRMVHKMNM